MVPGESWWFVSCNRHGKKISATWRWLLLHCMWIQRKEVQDGQGCHVYICDSRGVPDIYDEDGASTIAASEPSVVLDGLDGLR
uniref:Uncharacterized protein n=1 Tax=Triticum aestivum TaxID=4565 RepID=A0A077RSA2_WHEAT|nr:unnamed protein product [Triticum aestivum]